MAIRTISIFQGHYFALQGHWMWDELLGLSFPDVSIRARRSDHSISVPTIFTTPPRQHHIPSSTLIFPDSRISGIYLGGISHVEYREPASVEAGTFDAAEDDQQLSSLDSSLSSTEFDPPSRIESSHEICGLGISGLWSKDGSGPFTGLGVISIRPFPWRYIPTSGNLESNQCSTVAGSNIPDSVHRHNLLHEVSDTSVNTTQAQTQKQESIVERDPESSDAFHVVTETTPTQQPMTPINHSHSRRHTPSLPLSMKHFAAPTISSELKKISPNTHRNKPCRRRLSGSADISRGTNPPRFLRPHTQTSITLSTPCRSSDTLTKFAGELASIYH